MAGLMGMLDMFYVDTFYVGHLDTFHPGRVKETIDIRLHPCNMNRDNLNLNF